MSSISSSRPKRRRPGRSRCGGSPAIWGRAPECHSGRQPYPLQDRLTEQYNDQGQGNLLGETHRKIWPRDHSGHMATLKILDQTYTLPTTATERFRRLQAQIQLRQRLIQEGVRPKSRLWGLLPRTPAQLSMAERFHEFDLLVRDYDTIIVELHASKEAYAVFFTQLVAGVQSAVQRKSDEMRQIEQERAALQEVARAQHDTVLEQWTRQSATHLAQSVRLLGQAALLLLKKVALCQEGIKRLAEDQAVQRDVLAQLVGQLEHHRRAYALQQRIEHVTREVADMAEVALHFEAYIRNHFGPLQTLLDQVSRVDTTLHSAVAEIEVITQQMLQQESVTWHTEDAIDQRVLDFLTTSHLKRERLVEVLERLHQQDGVEEHVDIALATGDAVSVLEALDNIELLVQTRLLTLQHLPVNSPGLACIPAPPLPLESTPGQLFINSLGIEFVLIPAGTYTMGSRRARQGRRVTISQPFYMGKYPVTQAQWVATMGINPSRFQAADHPVENVSWENVQRFIGQLNAMLHAREGGTRYRLPTEAEWEYVARAAASTVHCFRKYGERH